MPVHLAGRTGHYLSLQWADRSQSIPIREDGSLRCETPGSGVCTERSGRDAIYRVLPGKTNSMKKQDLKKKNKWEKDLEQLQKDIQKGEFLVLIISLLLLIPAFFLMVILLNSMN